MLGAASVFYAFARMRIPRYFVAGFASSPSRRDGRTAMSASSTPSPEEVDVTVEGGEMRDRLRLYTFCVVPTSAARACRSHEVAFEPRQKAP